MGKPPCPHPWWGKRARVLALSYLLSMNRASATRFARGGRRSHTRARARSWPSRLPSHWQRESAILRSGDGLPPIPGWHARSCPRPIMRRPRAIDARLVVSVCHTDVSLGPVCRIRGVASAQAMYRRSGSLTDRIILLVLVSRPTAGRCKKGADERGNGCA